MFAIDTVLWREMVFVFSAVAFLPFSLFVKSRLISYDIQAQLGKPGNIPVAVSISGYLLGVVIILFGAYLGPSKGFQQDLFNFLAYGFLGVFLLNLARFINYKVLFRKYYTVDEMIRDKNVGAGAVEAGSYIASALVVAGSIYGEGGGIVSTLVFFLLGQIVLLLATYVYDFFTPYDLQKEIESDNAAAGIAFSGILIGTGVILLKGIAGNFTNWQTSLVDFSISVVVSLAVFPAFRLILDKVLIPRVGLNRAIQTDRNVAVGLLEMSSTISVSVMIYFMLHFSVRL